MHNSVFNEEQRSEHLNMCWSHYVLGLLFPSCITLFLFIEASESLTNDPESKLVLVFL
jgi:hypothetical protein